MARTTSTDRTKPFTCLAAALKAPRITEAAARLAGQARANNWGFEDYLGTRRSRTAVLGRRETRPSQAIRRPASRSARLGCAPSSSTNKASISAA